MPKWVMDGEGGGGGGFLVDPIIKRLCYASPPFLLPHRNAGRRHPRTAASFSHIAHPALPYFGKKSQTLGMKIFMADKIKHRANARLTKGEETFNPWLPPICFGV